ncbi:NUDIX hydrolase [Flavobacterium sp. xlx-214]|uniref:NUDIX domain-containing protein n=1 Tax=unclassified Flavobacterium TaxID=196869 RepID=UPI0013D1F956|nr:MULTISPECIES: NUDIX hydrolase [unclassified Flavobacterium]MBA5791821.1 NUDIX hydrolase [Flavobacterium sp. xlx-221]QMI83058.1 NUDIX hydrolase [Flavobacterium sp. xlx-214]
MKYTPTIFVTVDITLFRKVENAYEILLIQRLNKPFQDYWALPGGFVDQGEDLETAAKRELFEETDIHLYQVKQIKAYGNPTRDPRSHTLSVAFFGEIDNLAQAKAKDDAKNVQWFSIDGLPILAFDHAEIIRDAIEKHITKPAY